MDEFEIIRSYFCRQVADPQLKIGIGDDCAVFNPGSGHIAVTTDTLVEGVHFFSDADPEAVGFKSLAVNVSDLAAMGAVPKYFTLALTIPEYNSRFLEKFSHGLFRMASSCGISLIGGDTTHGPLSITITAIGTTKPGMEITRSGARPGDEIYVSGELGGAALAVFLKSNATHLTDPLLESDSFMKLDYPQPRVELGCSLAGVATSMLDLSDGLSSDLMHILEQSATGAHIELEQIPYSRSLFELDLFNRFNFAVSGGDDYELCFTVPPEKRNALKEIAEKLGISVTRIGTVTADRGEITYTLNGIPFDIKTRGYNHFAK